MEVLGKYTEKKHEQKQVRRWNESVCEWHGNLKIEIFIHICVNRFVLCALKDVFRFFVLFRAVSMVMVTPMVTSQSRFIPPVNGEHHRCYDCHLVNGNDHPSMMWAMWKLLFVFTLLQDVHQPNSGGVYLPIIQSLIVYHSLVVNQTYLDIGVAFST